MGRKKSHAPKHRLRPFRAFSRTARQTASISRTLWPYLTEHRGMLVAGASTSLVYVLLRIAQPWPLKWIIDILSGEHPALLSPFLHARTGVVAALAAAYVLAAFAAALAEYGQRLILAGLGNRVVHRFRTQVFSHVLFLPLAFHERKDTGELITRVVYDTARLRQGLRALMIKLFQNIFLFIGTFVVLLWVNAGLAVAVGVSGVLIVLLMGRDTRRIRRASLRSRKREGKLASVVTELLLGIRELQAFRPGETHDDRFDRQNRKSLKQEQKVRRLGAGLVMRVEVVLAATVALILAFGAFAVDAGHMTAGDLILFVSYATGLARPYRQMAWQSARLGRTAACADRLMRLVTRKPAVADRPDAVPVGACRGEITFENVSLKSPRRVRSGRKLALDGVSFTIRAGQRVAVVGDNGAGKSTLLRMILRLADPTDGVVRIDGRDLRDYQLRSVREQMSVIFQDSVFFGLSVRDNIAFGRPAATLEAVEEAARRARCDVMIRKLKRGYDTVVRRRGHLFSSGERQRIAVARALLGGRRIWLLDEPVTSMDAATAKDLSDILIEETRGRTVLWVTHEPGIVERLDYVVDLTEGRLRFAGTPQEYAAARSAVPRSAGG